MAKKAQKGKPVKKAAKPAKPAKKAAAKPAKPAKKAAPKKAAKPAKKVVAKPVKKAAKPAPKKTAKPAPKKVAKPAKKVVAKPAKKAAKPVKKAVKSAKPAKKAAKPVKAAGKTKPVAKKTVKPAKVTKPVAKKVSKPVAKAVAKPIAKPVTKKVEKPVAKKPVAKETAKSPVKVVEKATGKTDAKKTTEKPVVAAKPVPPTGKKVEPKKKFDSDLDDDGSSREDEPMVIEYKTPSIQRPMGPIPKPHINTDNRTRYTDAELKEFKQLILKKLEEAQKDFELLKSTLSHKDDHGTDDTSPTFKLLEDGSDVLSKEETAHLASRQEKFIQNLQNALIRIENKTYGICRATGKLISKERLRSVPHATLAIEAKLEQHN
jgi:RNA polymerase-binding transcription factor DksA